MRRRIWIWALAGVLPGAIAAAPAGASHACAASPCNRWASRLPLGPANEVHVAVDPTDPDHVLVVAKDYALGATTACASPGVSSVASASYVTFDGGDTWATARVPAPYPNGGAEPSPLPFACGSDPVAMFGPDGTAYYLVLNFQYAGGRRAAIAVARSPDGGRTWPPAGIRILHTSSGDDKQWGTVDGQGRVHVVWSDLTRDEILYARSTPAFAFEPPRALAPVGSGNPAVSVATGPADDVYVTWRDGASIRFTRSLDGGATFAAPRTAFDAIPFETSAPPRLPFMPQLSVDRDPLSPRAGRIYVVWPDAGQGDSAVFAASSGDAGDTWTAPVRVDDDPLPLRRQVMPQISVAPDGRVDVAWLDQRDDPSGATFRTYASSSTDGGATWTLNVAVSDVPLVVALSRHQNGTTFVGDYIGVASTAAALLVAYPGNGPDRLAEGLTLDRFARADAYLGRLARAPTSPVDGGPAGTIPSRPAPASVAAASPLD